MLGEMEGDISYLLQRRKEDIRTARYCNYGSFEVFSRLYAMNGTAVLEAEHIGEIRPVEGIAIT